MTKILLYGLIPLIVLALILVAGGLAGNRLPLTEPPGLAYRLKTYLTTNVAVTSPDSPFPELRPVTYPVAAQQLFDVVEAACRQLGWFVETAEREGGTLNVVITTPLWRFKDDMWIRVNPGIEGGSTLTIRASSRVGRADLGANARHILDLLDVIHSSVEGAP